MPPTPEDVDFWVRSLHKRFEDYCLQIIREKKPKQLAELFLVCGIEPMTGGFYEFPEDDAGDIPCKAGVLGVLVYQAACKLAPSVAYRDFLIAMARDLLENDSEILAFSCGFDGDEEFKEKAPFFYRKGELTRIRAFKLASRHSFKKGK